MTGSAENRDLPLRAAALVGATAVLLISTWQRWLLYADAAPFHQPYTAATPAQNASVTLRMCIALMDLPLVAVLLCVAARGAGAVWSRGGLRVVAGASFVTALHGWVVRFRLPYGFGSGYEHASAAQHLHLALATTAGIAGLTLAGALLGMSLLPSRKR